MGRQSLTPIVLPANPASGMEATTKNYVDAGLAGKAAASHTHAPATGSTSGFMGASDKSKLDGIASGATSTPLASTAPAALGSSASVGTAASAARADHVHPLPTAAQVGAAAASHTHALASLGIYVQSSDPGAVSDGSLWIW